MTNTEARIVSFMNLALCLMAVVDVAVFNDTTVLYVLVPFSLVLLARLTFLADRDLKDITKNSGGAHGR